MTKERKHEIRRNGKLFWLIRTVSTKTAVKAQRRDWKKHKPHLKFRSIKRGKKYDLYVGGI